MVRHVVGLPQVAWQPKWERISRDRSILLNPVPVLITQQHMKPVVRPDSLSKVDLVSLGPQCAGMRRGARHDIAARQAQTPDQCHSAHHVGIGAEVADHQRWREDSDCLIGNNIGDATSARQAKNI
jgi:hypothetical protein